METRLSREFTRHRVIEPWARSRCQALGLAGENGLVSHSMITRRQFIETVSAAAAVPLLGIQTPAPPANEWGSPVFDLHHHLRPTPEANLAHLDGAGITKANLLTRAAVVDQVKALQAAGARPVHLVQHVRHHAARRPRPR